MEADEDQVVNLLISTSNLPYEKWDWNPHTSILSLLFETIE